MGISCAQVSNDDLQTLNKELSKSILSKLKALQISTEGLTKEEAIAVISGLMTKNGYTQETVMNLITLQNRRLLNDAVSQARIKKMQEQEALSNNKIGNATFVVGEKVGKGDPRAHRDTLYVFTDNLQASNVAFNEEIGDTIEVEGGVKMNVKSTSAIMRTDSNGDLNPNAVGLVTKKNAQNKNGVFIAEEGFFQDTDTDFAAFETANRRAINKIKELIFGENSPYVKLSMVEGLATDKAVLPERFADKLADMLEKELGIYTQKVISKNGGFGLRVMKLGKPEKKRREDAQKKATEKADDIIKNLLSERPKLDSIMVDPNDRSLLSKVYPNIEQRMARVAFISEAFSRYLTSYVNETRAKYAKMENRNEEQEAYYRGLTRGTEADQRVYALGHFTINKEPLGSHILNNIKNDLIAIAHKGSTEEGIDSLAKDLLAGKGQLGKDFKEELNYREIEPGSKRAHQFAYARVRYLAQEYLKMANTEVFNALCRDAAMELEFNENIRLNFKSLPIEGEEEFNKDTTDTYNEDTIEEDKENANREGYMIKYKLRDPAKSLSIRIKTILGSLYKRDSKDPSQYVFNDLGSRVRMDALVAYRILLEEFSAMKNPESFVATLDVAIEKYPWLSSLRDKVVFNPLNPKEFDEDIRNEFFTTMRKAQVPYGMVSERGLLKKLNRSSSADDILDNVRANYEGHIVRGKHSIYTETGEANIDNCIAIHKLFSSAYTNKEDRITGSGAEARRKKKYAAYKNQPLGWALTQLRNLQGNKGVVEDVKKALDILAGMSEDHPNISLEAILKNLGIDTSKINVDSLLGDIPFLSEEELSEIETLDDLMEHLSENQVARIIRTLEAIEVIVNQTGNKRFQAGDHLITKFQSAFLKIGSALALSSEDYTAMTFRHSGSTRASYAAPDFISDLVGIVSNMDNIEEASEWLEKNYGQYDFFRDPITKEWYNTWLKDFFDPGPNGDYPFRKNFEYINVLSFMGSSEANAVGSVEKDVLTTGLIHAFFSANRDSYDNSYGFYRCPLISDVDACVLMKGVRYTGEGYQDKIINGLVKVVLQEINRINSVNAPANQNDTVKVEFYNSGRNNGAKFQYFPELNSRMEEVMRINTMQPEESSVEFVERRNRELGELVKQIVEEKAARFIGSMSDSAKLAMYKRLAANEAKNESLNNEENKTVLLIEDEAKDKQTEEEKEQKLAKMDELLTEFYYNDYFAQSQIQQLLGGDLAFYKNYVDYVKRNKQAYVCGDRLFARETDAEGNIIGELIETAIYMEDEDVMTNSYESLKDLLMGSNISDADKAIMRFALDSFKRITSTDGQSFRTIDSFKKIFKAKGGTWTDDMERAYQNIKNGKITAQDFLSLWNPIKPFYFGHESIKTGGRNEKVMTQHKNSEYMITALYSFLNTALNKSPKLVGLHKFMVAHNIDVVHFHSVVKEGYNSPFDLRYNSKKFDDLSAKGEVKLFGKTFKGSYNEYMSKLEEALVNGTISQEEYTEYRQQFDYKTADEVVQALERQSKDAKGNTKGLMFKQFPMDSYMIVQPSEDHLIDAEAILGTQIKNIIMADLPDKFSMTITLNGKERRMDREEAVRFYNALLVDNLLDAFSKVSDEFGSIYSLQKALFDKMQGNPKYGDDVKAALEINKEGTGFMLPFNSPTLSNKIEELVLSTFKNAIQRQKIKGGNAVLVSNFGLHDDLHVVYKEGDKNKGVDYIEAYLPATSSVMFKDFLVQKGDYQEIDFKKMEKALGKAGATELLDIIGYRIPTEDKYSIMPIRVIGFMPVTAGSTIMLPADIISMSGTDFDIDKLFLMIKEFDRITYPSALGQEYHKWLNQRKAREFEEALKLGSEEETEATIAAQEATYKKLGSILRNKKEGYTDEEINSLIDYNDTFADFMEERGFDMQYETPMYKIMRPDTTIDGRELTLDEISKQEHLPIDRRIAIRNNMIIDVMRQTLANEEVSKLLMQPGNFDRVRHSSRQQKIMHNPKALSKFMEIYKDDIKNRGLFTVMQSMSTKDLEAFYEDNATAISPLDIMDYVNMQKNLMDGNALIGMFAVNSSNHYKLQFTPVEIASDYQMTIEGVTLTHIDLQNSPINGERISRINAEFQAASPDNGKDPCLGDVGANTKTASRIGLLARLGLEPEVIGILNTCDDFVAVGKVISDGMKNNRIKLPKLSTFDLKIDKLTEMIALFRTDPDAFNEALSVPENAVFVAMFHKFMKSIDKLSSSLSGVSKVSRSDSPNGSLAISVPEAIQQYFGAEDFIMNATAPDSPIKGLEKLVDTKLDGRDISRSRVAREELREKIMSAPVPRLQAAYTLGIKSALSLCRDLFPGLSDTAMRGVGFLRAQTQKRLTAERDTIVIRKFVAELTMALLSENSIFASDENSTMMDKRNYYIHDFPMKFKTFKEKKNADGSLAYPEVVNLNIIQRITNLDGKGLRFKNVGKISDRSRKHFVEELESLLWSDKPEVVELAMDLFMYSYYDNGFQFGHSNFGVFFTTTYLKSMPRFIESLNAGNSKLMNNEFNVMNFVYQFILNHPELTPYLNKDCYVLEGKKLVPTTKKGKGALAAGVEKTGEPLMLIQAEGKLWVKNGSGENLYYTEIDFNKTQIPYYDMSMQFDEIKFSDLKERGHIGYIDPKKLNKAQGIENVPQDNEVKEFKEEAEIGNVPKDDGDFLGDAPVEDESLLRQVPEEAEEDPEDLENQAKMFSQIDSRIEALAGRIDQMEQALGKVPVEDTSDKLDSFTPTQDPDVKMCE